MRSGVSRRELIAAAAASPYATVGQRLFAARRNAELSIDEVAPMAGVSAEDIRRAEAGAELGGGVEVQLQRFIAALGSDSGTGQLDDQNCGGIRRHHHRRNGSGLYQGGIGGAAQGC